MFALYATILGGLGLAFLQSVLPAEIDAGTRKEVRRMPTEATDWIGEIDKVAERSIKRSKEILKKFEEENPEAEEPIFRKNERRKHEQT